MALRRYLGSFTLTLYGIGVMVGAGIFVLVGEVVALAGAGAWMAFVGSAVAALPTALSYAELSSRYPRSAGESVFAKRAFDSDAVAFLVGYLVLASGIASTAAVSHGFADYLASLLPTTSSLRIGAITLFLAGLSLLNYRGIAEATWLNVACTIASITALATLSLAGLPRWGSVDLLDVYAPAESGPRGATAAWLAATALSFYAFIGFEDLCNVAEEVNRPSHTMPRAILGALALATLVYVGVAVTAVSVVPPAVLAESRVPLVLVAEELVPSWPRAWLPIVALLAVTNTALFNLIMCSRLLYGMGRNGWIPQAFASIDPRRQTPVRGVVAAFVLATGFAVTGVLTVLAEATNAVLLAAFLLVNLSLVVIRHRGIPADDPTTSPFRAPAVAPYLGIAITAYLATRFSAGAYTRAAALLAIGAALYALARGRSSRSPRSG